MNNNKKDILKKESKNLCDQKEDETTWNKINLLFEKLINEFKNKKDVDLYLKDFEDLLFRSLLSERSKLNGTCINFLFKCYELNNEYNFVDYIPILIKLCGKSNKIFVKRAELCLLKLITSIKPDIIRKIIELNIKSNNKKIREVLFKIIELKILENSIIFNEFIEKGIIDPAVEVRNLAKNIRKKYILNEKKIIKMKNTTCTLNNDKSNVLKNKIIEKKKFNTKKNEIFRTNKLNIKIEECNNSLVEALEVINQLKSESKKKDVTNFKNLLSYNLLENKEETVILNDSLKHKEKIENKNIHNTNIEISFIDNNIKYNKEITKNFDLNNIKIMEVENKTNIKKPFYINKSNSMITKKIPIIKKKKITSIRYCKLKKINSKNFQNK